MSLPLVKKKKKMSPEIFYAVVIQKLLLRGKKKKKKSTPSHSAPEATAKTEPVEDDITPLAYTVSTALPGNRQLSTSFCSLVTEREREGEGEGERDTFDGMIATI